MHGIEAKTIFDDWLENILLFFRNFPLKSGSINLSDKNDRKRFGINGRVTLGKSHNCKS